MRIESLNRGLVFAALLVLVWATPAKSQDPPPYVRSVQIQLKQDQGPAWRAARKDLLAAHKKAGRGTVNVWQVVSGTSQEYWVVSPAESFAEMAPLSDWIQQTLGEPEATQLIGRLQSAARDRRILIGRFLADLSIIPEDGGPAPYIVVTRRYNAPGKRRDITAYYRDKILPEMKKAGVKASYLYTIFSGDDPRITAFVEPFDKWSDLDEPNPMFDKLGTEAAGNLMYPFWSMFWREDRVILRHIPELSHNP